MQSEILVFFMYRIRSISFLVRSAIGRITASWHSEECSTKHAYKAATLFFMVNSMKPIRSISRSKLALSAAAITGLILLAPVYAAKLADVSAEGQRWEGAQADSQKRVDALSQQRNDLSDKFRQTLRETEGVKLYIQQLNAQIQSQGQEMETLKTETRQIERTSVEIVPLMNNMLASLEKFVAMDMPFLREERMTRVQKLKDMMPRADVTVSEKYRRIVEAYQIEMEYGRTIEAYTADVSGNAVDVLRVGRVALMYQTPDGRETAYWDLAKNGWVKDNSYSDGVKEGLKVARKQTSPDLLVIPVLSAGK